MFTHSARFASVSLSGASPDVKANSINLVDKVMQRSISAQGTLSEGVDLYIPIFLAETEPQQAVRSAGDGLPVLMMADQNMQVPCLPAIGDIVNHLQLASSEVTT